MKTNQQKVKVVLSLLALMSFFSCNSGQYCFEIDLNVDCSEQLNFQQQDFFVDMSGDDNNADCFALTESVCNYYLTLYDDSNNAKIEFKRLPNGADVDTRISEEVILLVLRHFEAIENGDIAAFRATLSAQDMVDGYHQMELLVKYFGDIVGVTIDCFYAVIRGEEGAWDNFWHPIDNAHGELSPRNMGLSVTQILQHHNWALEVTISNNYNSEEMYRLIIDEFGDEWRINQRILLNSSSQIEIIPIDQNEELYLVEIVPTDTSRRLKTIKIPLNVI